MTPIKMKKMKDRKKDNKSRSSKRTRSNKTPLFEDINQIINTEKKKYSSDSATQYKKRSASKNDTDIQLSKKAKNNKADDDQSGTSYSNNDDKLSSDESEASDKESDESGDDEIKEKVQSDDESDSQQLKKKPSKKNISNNSIFTPPVKSSIQWYCRNVIFQKLKIVDEVHLDSNGSIMKELVSKFKIEENSLHINAYLNEFRKIIRRVVCSRRAYVKMMIGETMKRKY
jgi:hypothetical protein